MINNDKMMHRIYDIKYENYRADLPAEIIVDLDKFLDKDSVDSGMGNLNTRVYRAIKDITGCNATSCKVDAILK